MFKEMFLNEKPSYDRKIVQMLAMSRLPLTDTITKLLGYGKHQDVFHATDMEHLKGLSKLGKSKKQLSTFTHGLGSLVGAISVKPDVVARLEGNAVINFEFDIFSHPDKQGRRWIGTRGNKKSDFLQQAFNTKVIKLIGTLLDDNESMIKTDEKWADDMFYDAKFYETNFNFLENGQKKEVVKLYIDNVTSLMSNTMYSKIMNEIIDGSNKKTGSYDEVIMNKFTVQGVYSIAAGKYRFDHSMAQFDIKKLGYKYLGHVEQIDFPKFNIKTY